MATKHLTDADDCPNCWNEADAETCPHLLAGSDCPQCGNAELEKPRGGKVECPNCLYVVNSQNLAQELHDFDLTFRQAKRILLLFGYDQPATPGSAGSKLRQLCHEHDIDMDQFNDVMADLRQHGDGWVDRHD